MKLFALLSFLLLTTSTYSQTMTDAQMKEAATAMCNCMEPSMKKLHPQVLQMVKTIEAKGEKEAQTELMNWLTTASADDQKALGVSLAFLEREFSDTADVCQQKTNKYFPQNNFDNLDKKEMNRFLKVMEEMPACSNVLLFLKAGMKKEEESAEDGQ